MHGAMKGVVNNAKTAKSIPPSILCLYTGLLGFTLPSIFTEGKYNCHTHISHKGMYADKNTLNVVNSIFFQVF